MGVIDRCMNQTWKRHITFVLLEWPIFEDRILARISKSILLSYCFATVRHYVESNIQNIMFNGCCTFKDGMDGENDLTFYHVWSDETKTRYWCYFWQIIWLDSSSLRAYQLGTEKNDKVKIYDVVFAILSFLSLKQ